MVREPILEHPKALTAPAEASVVLCGISHPFEWLSPAPRHVTHVLLTHSPLYSGAEAPFLVRLACVKHAASVRSEPGSNSPVLEMSSSFILYLMLRRAQHKTKAITYALTRLFAAPIPRNQSLRKKK